MAFRGLLLREESGAQRVKLADTQVWRFMRLFWWIHSAISKLS
eukprot:CAMPEP_0196586164 /NCGR_PEP_ID=MMETSP1081-20130531/53372_1 /TAXON_ID=36882 /ORGANISM="Pyramimonas amylifera, Strain CCMP720" /LENGTH=42 /DNA_ID= /DNA_START= /DNA_END= /DNA_ORIENTATION=